MRLFSKIKKHNHIFINNWLGHYLWRNFLKINYSETNYVLNSFSIYSGLDVDYIDTVF